jgi:hypothetical protein
LTFIRGPAVVDGFNLIHAQRAVFRSELRSTEKLVALALLDHWSRSTETFPSVQRLSDWTSLDRTSVMRALGGLEQRKAVTVTKRKGAANRYALGQLLLLPVAESDRSEGEDTAEPVAQSDHSDGATSRSERPDEQANQSRRATRPVAESDLTSRGERHEGTQEVTQRRNPRIARAADGSPKEGVPKPKRKSSKASETHLPLDWQPTEANRAFAKQYGLDVELELVGFRGHYEGRSAVSWPGRFTTWLANQAKWNRQRTASSRKAPVQAGAAYDLWARAEQRTVSGGGE